MTNGEKIKEIFPNGLFMFKKNWLNEEYKEPTTKNNLGVDCISREQAIREADYLSLETSHDNQKVIEMLETLPSVTSQEPRKGHWINNKCDECGYGVQPWNNTNYCPNCGARMVEPQESEDKE